MSFEKMVAGNDGVRAGFLLNGGGPTRVTGFTWMRADKAARLVVGQAVVRVLITRYLGPERFGQLSYALALSSIGVALGGLGLDEIVVRELVSRPVRRAAVSATEFALKAAGARGAFISTVAAAWLLRPDEPAVWLPVATVAAGQSCAPWDLAEWKMQAVSTERHHGRASAVGDGADGLSIVLAGNDDGEFYPGRGARR